jgi:hypothetical protein
MRWLLLMPIIILSAGCGKELSCENNCGLKQIDTVKIIDSLKPINLDQAMITCVGDSLTFGVGVGFAQTYPSLLYQRFRNDGDNVTVINEGYNPVCTYQTMEADIPNIMKAYYATAVPNILVVGEMDPSPTYASDLRSYCTQMKDSGFIVVVIPYRGITPYFADAVVNTTSNQYQTISDSVYTTIKKLVK